MIDGGKPCFHFGVVGNFGTASADQYGIPAWLEVLIKAADCNHSQEPFVDPTPSSPSHCPQPPP